MFLSKNLKYLRLKSGFSQDYVAEILGYKSYTTIQKWEMGSSEPSISILKKLSKLYDVDMHTLYTIDLTESGSNVMKEYNRIPLIGRVAAGTPILAEENIEDYFNIDKSLDADFALRVKGDSMIDAEIYNDNIAFIKKQEDLENGEIGVILIDDEATLKRFYKNDGSVILQPENKNYNPIILTKGDVHVLGKLIAVLRKF